MKTFINNLADGQIEADNIMLASQEFWKIINDGQEDCIPLSEVLEETYETPE